jgi:heat shock protein HslJ
MKGKLLSFALITALASLTSCHTGKQSTTETAFIVGKYWKLLELNGETIQSTEQWRKTPHLILNISENKVNGSGGYNSFFGSYELQDNNGITFSPIGATKMACSNAIMQVEHQLFQAFEMTHKFTLSNDTLLLTKADLSPLAKFVVSDMK